MSEIIHHVSDTSLWVAYYRVLETERSDSIFKDPFAKILIGNRINQFAQMQSETTKWTQWTVVMRTHIIDQMINSLIEQGNLTIVNLGAGLDSRPYRMKFNKNIKWIEVDFENIIEHKTKILKDHIPNCDLERFSIDLSNRVNRKQFFNQLNEKYENIIVLTEGVLPYLTIEQVSELSEDLNAYSAIKYWISEYISPKSYKYLRDPKRMKALKNSPFQFYPEDWMGFFLERGWKIADEKYYTETSEKFNRPTPMPKIFKLIAFFKGDEWAKPFKQMSGFILWEKSK